MNTLVEHCRIDEVKTVLGDLPENCIFDILVRLPVETLSSWRFVCKSWYDIINSPDFRNAHLRRSSDTTTTRGLICLSQFENYSSPPKKVFSVKTNSMLAGQRKHYSYHIKFMEIKGDKSTTKEYDTAFVGEIVATCNGLIVLKNDPGTRLIIHNPVTRELEDIPLGTKSSFVHNLYGLAFCHASRRYKLLHLFLKDELIRNLGCEILDIGSGTWRALDVPPVKRPFDSLENPIFAMGALHWIQYVVDRGHCMVSMPLEDEKFKTMAIPDAGANLKSVFAMGEFLGFSGVLGRGSHHQIGVWILRGLGGEYGWEKQFNIEIASGLGICMKPLLNYCGGEFVFKCGDGCLYAYDHFRHPRLVQKVETTDGWASTIYYRRYFPHVNSLVSWRS